MWGVPKTRASPRTSDGPDRLRRWQAALLGSLALLTVAFGVVTFVRGAAEQHRHTDAGVYFRAAWAIRAGADPYTVPDDNGWHYIYPPTLALVIGPLADPPKGQIRERGLPYPVSIALWYVLNVAALGLALHWLASALEATSANPRLASPRPFGWRWWSLRIAPLGVCLFQIGTTLGRGQVTPIVLLCLAGMMAAALRGRRGSAGAWLGAAIVLKLYPAYLLLYPLWRGSARMLTFCMASAAVGLVIIPVVALGPERAFDCYRSLYHYLVAPAVSGQNLGVDRPEYLDEAGGNIASFKVVLFRLFYPLSAHRPASIPALFSLIHWTLGALITAVTLLAVGRRRTTDPVDELLFVGLLTTALLPIIPVSRCHYFALSAPLVMAIVASVRERRGDATSYGWLALLAFVGALTIIHDWPGLGFLADFQLTAYAEILLWAAGLVELRRRRGELGLPIAHRGELAPPVGEASQLPLDVAGATLIEAARPLP